MLGGFQSPGGRIWGFPKRRGSLRGKSCRRERTSAKRFLISIFFLSGEGRTPFLFYVLYLEKWYYVLSGSSLRKSWMDLPCTNINSRKMGNKIPKYWPQKNTSEYLTLTKNTLIYKTPIPKLLFVIKLSKKNLAVIQPRYTHILYQCADRTSFTVIFDVYDV